MPCLPDDGPDLLLLTGADVRIACRTGRWTRATAGLAEGFTQANLVVLPADFAFEFLLFCQRNPKPCPLLEVVERGGTAAARFAPGADLRRDLPRYRVWRNGELADEPTDVADVWRDDFVSFLIGCSFSFERALLEAGLPVRHIEQGRNVPMYRTNRACDGAGRFAGPLVVSMRPMTPAQAIEATIVTARFPDVHGAPVHLGDPAALGIDDLDQPDFGEAVALRAGEIPVFWACGVTPQCALLAARPPIAITHAPGCMFVTDRRDADLASHAATNP
ncbi:MAG: putative hydro-lyase [Planctomyces sp.]|nr:putative hydro-lyase [Planctomyces sp.]